MSGTVREIHIGIVTDNVDPEQRGRITVECATLAADGGSWPDFIEPCFPYLASGDQQAATAGWFFVPDVGVSVELEIVVSSGRDESPGAISVDAPDIRWRACAFARGVDAIGSEFTGDNYPNRRGIQTGAGHALVFDDTPDDPEVKLLQVNADGVTYLDFDAIGSAFIATSAGHLLYMNNETGISLIDGVNSNLLSMNGDGWYLATSDSDLVKAGGGEVQIMTGSILFNASGVTANVGGFSVAQLGLDTPVLVEGLLGFSSLLAASLTEIAAGLAVFGIPTTNTGTLIGALNASSFSATLLTSE